MGRGTRGLQKAGSVDAQIAAAITAHGANVAKHPTDGASPDRPAIEGAYYAVTTGADRPRVSVFRGGAEVVVGVSSFDGLLDKPTAAQLGGVMSTALGVSVATLVDVGGQKVVPTSQIPTVALTTVQEAASQAAMLALVAQPGDMAVRTDTDPDRTFMLMAEPATTLANWKRVSFGDVSTVNGQVGVVVLGAADVGATPAAHAGSRDGHPLATTALDGMMSSVDKTAIHTRAHSLHNSLDHTDMKGAAPTAGQGWFWQSTGPQGAGYYASAPAQSSVPNATQTETGVTRFATPAEAQVLTNAALALAPATMEAIFDLFLPVGVIMEYGGIVAPTGFLFAQGQEVSRTTYARLFIALTKTTTGTTVSNGNLITGLANTDGFHTGAWVEGPGVPINTTVVSRDSASQVTLSKLTGSGSGTGTFRTLPHGQGDGVTTFNVVNHVGRVGVGTGTITGQLTRRLGQLFGTDTHTLTAGQSGTSPHRHPIEFLRARRQADAGTPDNVVATIGETTFNTTDYTENHIGANAAEAHPNHQPSIGINFIIRI